MVVVVTTEADLLQKLAPERLNGVVLNRRGAKERERDQVRAELVATPFAKCSMPLDPQALAVKSSQPSPAVTVFEFR